MATLTPREREVLTLLAKGCSYKETAEKLGITYDTVNGHTKNIYAKLRVHSRAEALARFLGR